MSDLDEQAEISVEHEVLRRTNPHIEMREPGAKSAWKDFEASWTEKERVDELVDWSRPRVAEFIQATAAMVAGMFENSEDAASKALVSLAISMSNRGMARLDFSTRIEGCKFGASHEQFDGSIALSAADAPCDPNAVSRESREATLSAHPLLAPLPKIAPAWSDANAALLLWDQLRSDFGDEKGSKSAQNTALLLVHLEHMSLKNAGILDSKLEGLSTVRDEATVDLGLDATVHTTRHEAKIAAAPSTKTKM